MDNTFDKPFLISSRTISGTCPIFRTNLSLDTDLTWKQSAAESLDKTFEESGSIFIIHGAIEYFSFQSVTGTITFNGNFPKASSFTTITGRVFLI